MRSVIVLALVIGVDAAALTLWFLLRVRQKQLFAQAVSAPVADAIELIKRVSLLGNYLNFIGSGIAAAGLLWLASIVKQGRSAPAIDWIVCGVTSMLGLIIMFGSG